MPQNLLDSSSSSSGSEAEDDDLGSNVVERVAARPTSGEEGSSSAKGKRSVRGQLKVNESYASSYNRFREKEVYQRLKAKYGEETANKTLPGKNRSDDGDHDDDDDDESSSSSSEDETGEALTAEIEKDFFRTMSCLKRKDPRIYDGSTSFFKVSESAVKVAKVDKEERPVFLGDLEREVMLEKSGEFDELEDPELKRRAKSGDMTYVQEMAEIKRSFKESNNSEEQHEDDDEDGDGGLLLVKKVKTREEQKRDEADYREWLAGQKASLGQDPKIEEEMKGIRDYWNRKDLDSGERFLRDYILKRRYLDSDDEDDEGGVDDDNQGGLEEEDEEEEFEEKQAEFEHKFNFRYEEPDQEFIKRYPRTIGDSLRRKDNKRKVKRQEVQERKKAEKLAKRQELQQLKALKRQAIMDKILKLQKVVEAGTDGGQKTADSGNLLFNEEDLEEDFDPEKYDKRMEQIFDEYHKKRDEENSGTGGGEVTKPEFSDLSDDEFGSDGENWDDWSGRGDPHQGRGAEESTPPPEGSSTSTAAEGHRLRNGLDRHELEVGPKKFRKRSKFAELMERAKPTFDPALHQTFERYLDEYYKLDYEDLIGGDLRCRFKYRQVMPNDFGLSTEEVLAAPDRELNAWCSLRKTCQYRTTEEEQRDVVSFKQKGTNEGLKKKMLPSLFKEDPEEDLAAEKEKKARKNKKRRRREKAAAANQETVSDDDVDDDGGGGPGAKRAKGPDQPSKADGGVPSTEADDGGPSSDAKAKKRKKKNRKRNKNKAKVADNIGGQPQQDQRGAKVKVAKVDVNAEIRMSDDRLKAYGVAPNQFKRKVKKQKYKQLNQKDS